MAKSGMNPKTLQYIMGHADISVTLNTYTHVNFDDAKEELNRVANGWKSPLVKLLILPTYLPILQGQIWESMGRFEKILWKQRISEQPQNPVKSSIWEEIQDL